jgi:hypothetical protein
VAPVEGVGMDDADADLHHDTPTTAALRVAVLLVVLVLQAPTDAASLGEVGASC